MERLTERELYDGKVCFTKCAHTNCPDKCAFCYIPSEANEKLKEYEDMEEQGILVKLPCAIGSTVYIPVTHYYIGFERINKKKVLQAAIEEIGISERGIKVIARNGSDIREFSPSDFGKTIFADREQAKQALKEMQTSR